MSKMGWVFLGALVMTAALGWFSAQLIVAAPPGQQVLPMRPVADGALDNTVRSAECDGLKTALEKSLLGATACVTDNDCTVIRLDCPFDCANAIAEEHFVRLYRMQDEFTAACGVCQSACTSDPPPTSCRSGRCVLDRAASLNSQPSLGRPGLPARPGAPPDGLAPSLLEDLAPQQQPESTDDSAPTPATQSVDQ